MQPAKLKVSKLETLGFTVILLKLLIIILIIRSTFPRKMCKLIVMLLIDFSIFKVSSSS